jgi:hypothetical protein
VIAATRRALGKGLLCSPFLLGACMAPYGPAQRDDIAPGARWFNRLTIE